MSERGMDATRPDRMLPGADGLGAEFYEHAARTGALHLQRADAFLAVLAAPPGQAVSLEACAWPAWQIWTEGRFAVSAAPGGWCVALGTEQQPPKDWLAAAIEQLHG